MKTMKPVRTAWVDTILVCRKCSKKLDGGFGPGGRKSLSKALRERISRDGEGNRLKKRKQPVGLTEVGCFGLCPKRAVTVSRGCDPGVWWVIPEATPVDDVAALLQLPGTIDPP